MRYIELFPVINAQPYLAVLPSLARELPAGALAFASDPAHYDFYGTRCVKDLELAELRLSVSDEVAVEARLDPNRWKHDTGLKLCYEKVTSLRTSVVGVPVGLNKLGSLILDELLPHQDGVRHELAFHGGELEITCADLTATWE